MFGIGKFVVGNIYIGCYMEMYISLMGVCICFGCEFMLCFMQLKGWYKYICGISIDCGDYNVEELKNLGGDKCVIYIVLIDNEGLVDDNGVKMVYEVNNNKEGSFMCYMVDFFEVNKDVIVYGFIIDEEFKGFFDESGNVVWKQFMIDLKYCDLICKFKYIIVVVFVSKYGDFFIGSESSVMLIDDFELVYGIFVIVN